MEKSIEVHNLHKSYGALATPLTSILILLATAVVFFALSVWNLSRKKK